MTTRSQKTSPSATNSNVATLLLEIPIPENSAYAEFTAVLDNSLAKLEERFRTFVTTDSYVGSLGR